MYPKDMGMTGREGGGGGCISLLHSMIQLQRDGRGAGRGGGISLGSWFPI